MSLGIWVANALDQISVTTREYRRSPPPPEIVDSAYASMSAPGLDSATPSGHGSRRDQIAQPAKRQKLYNHETDPEGIVLSLERITVDDSAEKRLVVKRLERHFAGKGNFASGHLQALRREQMLHTSGRTHSSENTEISRREPIVSEEAGSTLDSGTQEQPHTLAHSKDHAVEIADKHDLASELPDCGLKETQPMRPSDFDPTRAQFPVEDFGYLKHLGLSSPGPTNIVEGGDLIDLNRLMDMAQLHILNVTRDFVRDALYEYGVHFEMPNDGHAVRYNGDSCSIKHGHSHRRLYMRAD